MQLALAAGGAVIGSFFGAPMLGWFAGSLLGAALGGKNTEGPKLSDLRVMGSSYGNPIPLIWPGEGIPVGGNVVWKTDLVAHSHTSSAKGGPKVTTTTYTVSFRVSFGKCFGDNITLGRVWRNNRLVDDFRQGSTVSEHLPLVFYDGNPDQLPDPTEEAIEGVGMVPAYRGVASVVFTDVATESNVLDQYRFELIAGASHVDKALETVTYNANDDSPPGHQWPYYGGGGGAFDANCPAITAWSADDGIRVRGVTSSNVYTYNPDTLEYIGTEAAGADDSWGATVSDGGGGGYMGIGHHIVDGVRLTLWATGTRFTINGEDATGGPKFGPTISTTLPVNVGAEQYEGSNLLTASGIPLGDVFVGAASTEDKRALLVLVTSAAQWASDPGVCDKWYLLVNGLVNDSGDVIGWPEVEFVQMFGSVSRINTGYAAMLENDRKTCWLMAQNSPSFRVWQINDAGEFRFATQHSTHIGDGGLAPPTINNSTVSVYALASGCKCGAIAPGANGRSAWLVERCTFTGGSLFLSDIVSDVCDESDMEDTERDVDAIPIPVRAFIADQTPVTGRAIFETLLPVYFVDARDRDGVAVFTPRGKQPDVTVPRGDLIVRSEGEGLAPRLRTVTGNYSEQPRSISFSFINPNADYLTGTQHWQRMTGGSQDARNIRVAVCLSDEEAKRVVDMWGESAWTEADKHSFVVDRKYLKYEGTDVMVVEGVPIRIEKKKEGIKGELTFEGVRNDPGLIAQTGVPGDSGGGFVPPEIATPQDTDVAMIDGPFIGSDPREGLVPIVMQGHLRRSWAGAQANKSLDGTNYTPLFNETTPGTFGTTQTVLGSYGGAGFDEQNVLRVLIPPGGGDLVSVSRDAALAGENPALVGTDEQGVRGEIINYCNADLVSQDETGTVYDISRILRGRRASWPFMAGHAVGESFITLPAPSSLNLLPSDLGIARSYKAPTIGRTLATAPVYPFKSHGLPLAAFPPRFVRMGFLGAPGSSDILIEWNRSSRVARGWLNFRSPTGLGPPLGEEEEKYRLRIFEDGTKQTVLSYRIAQNDPLNALTATQYKYTIAQQTEDFGAPLEVLPALNVAQKCAIGWGWDSDGGVPIFVPGDLPNYVPPYPPLDDARFVDSTIAWSEAATISSGLGPDDIWCVRINIGSTPTGAIPVLINTAEYNNTPPSGRVWAISTIRGDTVGQGHPMASSQGQSTNSVTAQFFVGAGGYLSAAWPTFPASSTVYLNIKTTAPNGPAVDMFATIKRIP